MIVTTFADSSSGISALGFSGSSFLIQLITFLLAYLVLRRYAFGPIIKVMRARKETIENGVKLGEQLKQEQAELEQKSEQVIHEARSRADGIIAAANETGREVIKEAEDKAKTKASLIVEEAESRIEQDTARARIKLEKEIVGLVSDVTEAVIHEKVDATKDGQLIERAIKERV